MLQKTFALTERSLRVDARAVQGHLLRFLLAGAVLLTLTVLSGDLGTAPGLVLMSTLAYGNAVIITLAGPIFFGSCITEEKEERTLPLLLMADIGPLAILSGKLLPKLISVLLVLTVQIPFTLLAITLGGVLFDQILAIYIASAAYLLAIAGLSVMCSVFFRQSSNAIGGAGLLLMLYFIGPSLVWGLGNALAMNGNAFGNLLSDAAQFVMSTNVFSRLSEILAVSGTDSYWTWQVGSNLLFGVFAFGMAWLFFDLCTRELESAPPKTRRGTAAEGTALPPRRVWGWPVVWKEFQILGGGRRMMIGKFIGYGCILAMVAFAASDFGRQSVDVQETFGAMCWVMFLAASIEFTLLIARTFSSELKEQTWSTLNLLPFSVSKLAYSKLLGMLTPLAPATSWLLLSLLLSGAMGEFAKAIGSDPGDASYVLGVSTGHYLLFLNLVLFFSIVLRNSWGGIVAGMLTHYFGAIFVGMFLFLFLQLGSGARIATDTLMVANLILPWVFVLGLHFLSLRLLQRDVELR